MPNIENLKKGKATQFKSGEDAAEKGKKGGQASGVAKRQRKLMRELLEDALFNNSKTNNKAIEITSSLIKKAIDGDVRAYEVIRDTLGEKPIEQIQNVNPPTIEDDL